MRGSRGTDEAVIDDASACSHRQLRSTTARNAAIETADQRAAARVAGARHRERVEADYQTELRETVLRWLDFAPEHHDLAAHIADGAAAQATVVGSGRVGRTKTLSVDERAALAARAYIRHHHTDYDDRLDNANVGLGDDIDDDDYREIKRAAHDAGRSIPRQPTGITTSAGGSTV